MRENFPYRRSLRGHQLLEGLKKGNLCDIEVPDKLKANFSNFPPIFKNTLVSKTDTGESMKTYAEEEGRMTQPQKKLTSSFTLQNGTLITPLLLFYLQLALVLTKNNVLLSAPQRNVSKALYRQQWTQKVKVTEISIQVSLRRQ